MGNARPFSGMNNTEFGARRDPFLLPNNVVRDLQKPEGENIVSSTVARYVVRVDEHEYSGTRKAGDKFKAKLSVMAGDGPNAVGTGKIGLDGKPTYNRAVFMVMANSDYFDRDVAQHLCALFNCTPKPYVNSQGQRFPGFVNSDFEVVVSKQQPGVGKYAYVEVSNRKSQKGKDFTDHFWEPIDPVLDAQGNIVDWRKPAINNFKEWLDATGGK